MKKKILVALIPLFLATFIFSIPVSADQDDTDLGIEFGVPEEESGEVSPPIYPGGPTEPAQPSGTLPHTGEVITSFIVMLSGLSLIICVVGIVSIRKAYGFTEVVQE